MLLFCSVTFTAKVIFNYQIYSIAILTLLFWE